MELTDFNFQQIFKFIEQKGATLDVLLSTCKRTSILTTRGEEMNRNSLFASLSKFQNIKNILKFVLIERKGNPDGSLSNYPSLRTLWSAGFIDKLELFLFYFLKLLMGFISLSKTTPLFILLKVLYNKDM